MLLLHGLAGHAGEWAETARWLTERYRVVAVDARGHGHSERIPREVSRAAHVDDAVFVIERLGLGPVVLVGQSLGGHAALLVAAKRPDLVRGLVVADASPASGDDRAVVEVGEALAGWPVPFASRLEERDGGWWPRFDVGVMVRTLREAVGWSYWPEWKSIRCPTLVVRAGDGVVSAADAEAMADRLPQARLVELAGAQHDLHLDRPTEWREVVEEFLRALG